MNTVGTAQTKTFEHMTFYKSILAALLFSISITAISQTLVNEDWSINHMSPSNSVKASMAIDPSGNIITTGNTMVAGQQSDMQISCIMSDGTMAWEHQYDNSNGMDYGVDVVCDDNGNIYATGASFDAATNSYDFVTLKYDVQGALLWENRYNGTGDGDDIPVAIKVDAAGNSYVTGVSMGVGTMTDYATIKYNSNGNQQWVSRYDNNGLLDAPTDLQLDQAGKIYVTGSSSSSTLNSDYTTIKYNKQNGNELAVNRHITTGDGIDIPMEMKISQSNKVYLTGKAINADGNYDMKTIKMSSNLALEWEKNININGLEDVGNALDISQAGNVYVTGYTEKVNGGKDMIIAKYDASGNEQWIKKQVAEDVTKESIGSKIVVDSEERVHVVGSTHNLTEKEIITMIFDETGAKKFVGRTKGMISGAEKAFDIKLGEKDIFFILGNITNLSGDQLKTIKFSVLKVPAKHGGAGGADFVKNRILVRFDRSVVSEDAVNNKKLLFGPIGKFIDAATIAQMQAVLNFNLSTSDVIKVHKRMITEDINTISRMGQTIISEPRWTTFIIQNNRMGNEMQAVNALKTLFPTIKNVQPDYIYKLLSVPNDDEYATEQASLHATATYPNAHINIEGAWDRTHGENYIKVGVYDSGIDWSHIDFSINGATNTYVGSKINGGWDFPGSMHIKDSPVPDPEGHGTKCAGIIGALRNNGEGIAGIAGGNIDDNNESGCQLFAMKISDEDDFIFSNQIAAAIIEGAAYNPNTGFGYGLHVMNHSWGGSEWFANDVEMEDALRYTFRHGVVTVAAKGNDGVNTPSFPVDFRNEWIVSVGAIGTDGEYKQNGNGNPADPDDYVYAANWGNGIDLVAAGTNALILSTNNNGNGYIGFNGTSAAAPHVAGVAALMLSYYNPQGIPSINLAPEDIEHILEASASDRTGAPASTGYDEYTGHGLLDATQALQLLRYPQYKVRHFSIPFTSANVTLYQSNVSIVLPVDYGDVVAGQYFGDVYKVTRQTVHSLETNEVILDAWVRNSASNNVWGLANPVDPEINVTMESYNDNGALLTGYIYNIKSNLLGQQIIRWYPSNPSNTGTVKRLDYTLHTFDTEFNGVEEFTGGIEGIQLGNAYPNPSENNVNINYFLPESKEISLDLVNLEGRIIKTIFQGRQTKGIHTARLSLIDLAQGIYFYRLKDEANVYQKKLVKIK